MSYTLQAIIGDDVILRANAPAAASVLSLPQGKAMIPLCDELLDETGIPFLPLTDGGQPEFADAINEFASPLIGRGKFVYVEAEFFGGNGTQACLTWDEKGNSSDTIVDTHAINTALKFLGVQVGDCHDEFDALGFGRYRDTQGWLAEAKAKKVL